MDVHPSAVGGGGAVVVPPVAPEPDDAHNEDASTSSESSASTSSSSSSDTSSDDSETPEGLFAIDPSSPEVQGRLQSDTHDNSYYKLDETGNRVCKVGKFEYVIPRHAEAIENVAIKCRVHGASCRWILHGARDWDLAQKIT